MGEKSEFHRLQSRTQWLLGVGGMFAGAVVGCGAFWLLWQVGLYAIMLVGLCTGLGCSWLARFPSQLLGIGCAAVALPATLLIGWHETYFVVDDSLLYYVQNLYRQPLQLVMVVLSVVMAYYIGKGR